MARKMESTMALGILLGLLWASAPPFSTNSQQGLPACCLGTRNRKPKRRFSPVGVSNIIRTTACKGP